MRVSDHISSSDTVKIGSITLTQTRGLIFGPLKKTLLNKAFPCFIYLLGLKFARRTLTKLLT